MLSIILYGRNDSHGYNLHKRAALSLNCMAEVLSEPSDEIIFVDYNTPDELPTFPESISDTLTEKCKNKLRVLRVRPTFHSKFLHNTHIEVLECQSRNIAIRRSNKNNKWILSTNTDMIFSVTEGCSLSQSISRFNNAYYHLPRFEVPEGIWERLPRQSPGVTIEKIRQMAARFHLNEIVYGSYDNIYEGPGDFQLFLREDLFDIQGFDERMILGWHADANIARRMRLLKGEVSTAFDKIYGYHCGHTRQATKLHKGVRTENNQIYFVEQIDDPYAPWQADSWGYPDENIEEIRFDDGDIYISSLEMAITLSKSEIDYTQTSNAIPVFSSDAYELIDYQADHVLPHLCDLVFNLKSNQRILFYGNDVRLHQGLEVFLTAANKNPTFLRCEDSADEEALSRALLAADLFVIQYPSVSLGDADARAGQAWRCRRLLALIVQMERLRPPEERRRVIVVNAIHNGIAEDVETFLSPSSMPFSTRLRQGFVQDEHGQTPVMDWTLDERLILGNVIEGLNIGRPVPCWERLALELFEIGSADQPSAQFDLLPDQRLQILAASSAAIDRISGAVAATPQAVTPRAPISSYLCSSVDWMRSDWLNLNKSFFNGGPSRFSGQNRWIWARLAIVSALLAALPRKQNLSDRPKVLLVAAQPDMVASLIVQLGYDLTYTTSEYLTSDGLNGDWSAMLQRGRDRVPPFHQPLDNKTDGRFQAILALMPAWVEQGATHDEALIQKLAHLAEDNAVFIATATVQLNNVEYEGGFTWAEWNTLFAPTGPLGRRGFTPLGEVDTRIPLDTVVRFAFEDAPSEVVPGLSYGFLEGFNTAALICARWPARLQA